MKKSSLEKIVHRAAMISVMAVLLTGCATPKFSCTDDMKGPGCRSVSQVYANAHHEDAPQPSSPTGMPVVIRPGDPLRSGERVLRVWMAPWVDKDGDYHDQAYIYLVLDHGHWYIDKARNQIQRHFAPQVTPPVKAGSAAQSAPDGTAAHEADASQVLK